MSIFLKWFLSHNKLSNRPMTIIFLSSVILQQDSPASTMCSKVGNRLCTLVLMERRMSTEDKLAYLMRVRRRRRPLSSAPWTFPETAIIRSSGSGKLVY